MARVIVMTTAEKGHVNPMVGVAQWLRRLGHQVTWVCIPEPARQVQELGFPVHSPTASGCVPELVTGGEPLARLVRDRDALRAWIRTLLLDLVPGQVEPVRALFSQVRPDVVATDPMLYQGVIAAHLEGLPWAGISSSLNPVTPEALDTDLIRNIRALAPAREALFTKYGIAPTFRVADCLSPHLNTVFTTPEHVGDVDLPPQTFLVGPSRPPEDRGDEPAFPWERLAAGRRVVYASFGSQVSWQPELFRKVASAVAPLDVTLVLSAGELAQRGLLLDLPGDVVAVPYAPQLRLLERAAAFVTHGGANSVMEALWAGVPLAISPICNDQPMQAWFLERSGAGLRLDLDRASVEECRDAMAELLAHDSSFRANAKRVSRSYRVRDGAREAAERVAALA